MYNKKIFVVVIFIFIIVAMILMLHRNQKISSKIRSVYNKTEQTIFEVKLSDFTDFEWDNVIIYTYPITQKELSKITGINYTKEPDLQSGMIFLKNKQIVYEEVFENDFESPSCFIIYPFEDINSDNKVKNFLKDEAVFRGEKIYYNGENRYILKPLLNFKVNR